MPGPGSRWRSARTASPFRQVFSTHNERAKTLQVPILPVRCDNFRIRLSGKGGCLVKSIIREFALGSEY